MNDTIPAGASVAGSWTTAAIDILERIRRTQSPAIATASEWAADAIAAGGLAHLFGSGHSRIAVEEMFPRYGSFPGFNPLIELSTTFHTQVVGSNGQRQAMMLERVSGLAEAILANFAFGRSDVLMVFSVSGTAALPIELVGLARERGLRTIAVTSVEHSQATDAPLGRLCEVADLVIDLCTPPGDAMVTVPGLAEPVGPGSTVAAVAVVNEIKTQTAEHLVARGMQPPVLAAGIVVGPQRSRELFDSAYDDHARRIALAIGGAADERAEITAAAARFAARKVSA